MTKSSDEIKKGLECDPLALIRQLHADNCRLTDELYNAYNVQNEQLVRINQLEAERDAAVSDIARGSRCSVCKKFFKNGGECSGGVYCIPLNFEWRGVQEGETENG